MDLEPPSDRVILKPHPPETETAGGILLPEIAQEQSLFATVLAVGEGLAHPVHPTARIPLGLHECSGCDYPLHGSGRHEVQPGDVVLMPRFSGTEIDYDGSTVVSILASELLAVVT